jgi:hypothetical protein
MSTSSGCAIANATARAKPRIFESRVGVWLPADAETRAATIHLLGQFIIGTMSRISKIGTAPIVGVSSFNLAPLQRGFFIGEA